MYDIAECNVPVIREWALKQRHEYSIADFSRLTGISPSHIRNILFQYDGIGLLSAKRISVGTGIPIEKLIGEDEEPNTPDGSAARDSEPRASLQERGPSGKDNTRYARGGAYSERA